MIEPKAVGEDKTAERAPEFIVRYWTRFTISICIFIYLTTFDIKITYQLFMNLLVYWLTFLFNFHFGFISTSNTKVSNKITIFTAV